VVPLLSGLLVRRNRFRIGASNSSPKRRRLNIHRSLPAHRTRITYSVHARGAGAAEIGPAISSDFPDVLAALVALAERDPT